MYDLVIIGGGPAGLTAALYAARKRINFVLLTKELGGQVLWTKDIENYMGYQFITGQELIQKFTEQIRPLVIENMIIYEAVSGLKVAGSSVFTVSTSRAEYTAKSLIIASGKRPRLLDVPGEIAFRGRGVSYCATCDGPLFKQKDVVVVGGGNSAVQAALELSKVANKIYLVDRSGYNADAVLVERVEKTANIICLHQYETREIIGEQVVQGIVFADKAGKIEKISVQGIFIEVGLQPNSEFVPKEIICNDRREIIVDSRCHTNVLGIFAAGDVTNSVDKQIVIAAGDGAKAAMSVNDYLLQF